MNGNEEIDALYERMSECRACALREGCTQVVLPAGNRYDPLLMIIGDSPGQEEDMQGKPFVGQAGQLLREALRETGVIRPTNTLISGVINCRPPKNKFPTDDSPAICISNWLLKEIELAKPKRLLLLGGAALKHVANMSGVTTNRGRWYDIRGIRTMATFHPSYVMRQESEGKMQCRQVFESDIREVAKEVGELLQEKAPEQAPAGPSANVTPAPGSGYDWEAETRRHIDDLAEMLEDLVGRIRNRAREHDASKLRPPESTIFSEMVPMLKRCEYGSEEYRAGLEKMRPALTHHYSHNRHHPEFHDRGLSGMNLVDIMEMFCDWAVASKRNVNGSFNNSLEVNRKRFDISPELADILKNTAIELGIWKE